MTKMILSILVLSFAFAHVTSESCDVLGQLKSDKKDCGKFFQCTNQGWQGIVCPSGLHFNPKISVCDWPSNVDCIPDNDDEDDQSKLEPCDNVGQLKADAEKCDTYHQCTEKGWELKSCQSPLLFNPNSLVCDKGFTCGGDADHDDHSADTDNDNDDSADTDKDDHSRESHNDDDHSADNDHDDQHDHSDLEPCSRLGQMKGEIKNCQQYYFCTADGWESRQCRAPLLFNSISKTCDYAIYVTCAK